MLWNESVVKSFLILQHDEAQFLMILRDKVEVQFSRTKTHSGPFQALLFPFIYTFH